MCVFRTFITAVLLFLLTVPVSARAQQSSSVQVEPMEKTPVFRVDVVSRTTQAVNYRHRAGATRIDFKGTQAMPQAAGSAAVQSKTGRLDIEAKFRRLEQPSKFGLEYMTYVLWAITPEGRADNLGELLVDNGGSGGLHVTTELQAFGMVVTAEPYFAVTQPSDVVVAENVIRADTLGRQEQINARYQLLPRGIYQATVEKIDTPMFGVDRNLPLDLLEARNALRIARAAKADQYAMASYQRAMNLLKQAEEYYSGKKGRTPIGTVARDAVQTAEDARIISLKKQEEERQEAERRAAADREAKARAQAEEEAARRAAADEERVRAERAKAEAEQARQEALRQQQAADVARAAALEQQRAAQAEAEKARAAAEDAERQRQAAEADKAALRAKLLQQFNTILSTRDTPRGLVINMSDVLFEFGKYNLRPEARERLAKISGIVSNYPELHFVAEGHTDNVGSDLFNQQLSERRAAAVREYLIQQGIDSNNIAFEGLGKTQPVASNTTPTGRQQNRRVELVVSGEVIGTRIGSATSTSNPDAPPR